METEGNNYKNYLSEDAICVKEDNEFRHLHPEVEVVGMKRQDYRELFTKVVERFLRETDGIEQHFSSRTPEYLERYLYILRTVCRFIHTEYLSRLFLRVRETVRECFKSAPEPILRNITRQYLESIVESFEKIFDRLMVVRQDKDNWNEHFLLEVMLPLIRCGFLKSKIVGTKILAEFALQIIMNTAQSVT